MTSNGCAVLIVQSLFEGVCLVRSSPFHEIESTRPVVKWLYDEQVLSMCNTGLWLVCVMDDASW